jgi:hypothetical protein
MKKRHKKKIAAYLASEGIKAEDKFSANGEELGIYKQTYVVQVKRKDKVNHHLINPFNNMKKNLFRKGKGK